MLLPFAAQAAPSHPLDPLDAEELATIGRLMTHNPALSPDTELIWTQLIEPPKQLVESFKGGADFARKASVDAIDYGRGKTYRAVVNLRTARIESLTDLGALQPGLTDHDIKIARETIDADPRIKEALVKRGFPVTGRVSDAVRLEPMSVGIDRTLQDSGGRLIRVLFGAKESDTTPFISGLMAVVDVFARRVIKLHDTTEPLAAQVPAAVFAPTADRTGRRASAAAATGPQDRDFAVTGNVVTWDNWRFRFGFNNREGLVLYRIGFNDRGHVRPIAYRAALSEVITSYADPSEMWSWMQVFDEGALGLGILSIPIKPGQLVPDNAVTLSAVVPATAGPRFSSALNNRIYLYERDGGNLLYYFNPDGRDVHARSTELVIGFATALGNYTYGFNWVFRQDGSFAFQVELLGTVLTKVAAKGSPAPANPGPSGINRATESNGADRYGGFVYPNVVGVSHQHWFNLRVDFDVDGAANAVMENNVRSTAERRGVATDFPTFTAARTIFRTAIEAKRDGNHDTDRSWTVFNPSSIGPDGRLRGYRIASMSNTAPAFPRTQERGTPGFTFHQFWATPYRDGQLYAAGGYPYQAGSGYRDTLFYYADDSAVYDKDIVVWYSLGMTHIPRPEDFPVMSGATLSVGFEPDNFFERNPALGPVYR